MKTHPTPEEWMSFLYGEDSPARHAELDAHLRGCTQCHQQVQTWRGSMTALDAWTVPPLATKSPARPALRWAAAAVVVLGLGFGLGRVSSPASADVNQLQAALRSEMDAKLAAAREEFAQAWQRQQSEFAQTIQAAATDAASEETGHLFTRFAKVLVERRQADHETYLAALKQIENEQLSNYATLRKDLNTVAVYADDGLSRTQEQLMELATIAQPAER